MEMVNSEVQNDFAAQAAKVICDLDRKAGLNLYEDKIKNWIERIFDFYPGIQHLTEDGEKYEWILRTWKDLGIGMVGQLNQVSRDAQDKLEEIRRVREKLEDLQEDYEGFCKRYQGNREGVWPKESGWRLTKPASPYAREE